MASLDKKTGTQVDKQTSGQDDQTQEDKQTSEQANK